MQGFMQGSRGAPRDFDEVIMKHLDRIAQCGFYAAEIKGESLEWIDTDKSFARCVRILEAFLSPYFIDEESAEIKKLGVNLEDFGKTAIKFEVLVKALRRMQKLWYQDVEAWDEALIEDRDFVQPAADDKEIEDVLRG